MWQRRRTPNADVHDQLAAEFVQVLKRLRKLRRRDFRRAQDGWAAELAAAEDQHQWRGVWRLSRKLAGTQLGPKK
eukprot:8549395-Pyramimonas_sp.AAC.1